MADGSPIRAVDILAQRLPSVPEKPAVTVPNAAAPAGTAQPTANAAAGTKQAGTEAKPPLTATPKEPQTGTVPGLAAKPAQPPAQPPVKPKPNPPEDKPQ
jgi:hypothetical protein